MNSTPRGLHRIAALLVFLLCQALPSWAATLHVWPDSPSPAPPYTNWTTAATNIQDAVDAAQSGDTVLVTNGVYAVGGRAVQGQLPNRIAVDKPLTVESVNGPVWTVIEGARTGRIPTRCVYLTNGAVLAGFTLTNGSAGSQVQGQDVGGGVFCHSAAARLTNCTLTGNRANAGGGAYQGTLDNCTLRGNSASIGGGAFQAVLNNCAVIGNAASSGGGAAFGTLNHCTLTGNSASSSGGGSQGSALSNCIAYYNTAPKGSNYSGGALNYCCTTPLPGDGTGNFTADPQLTSAFHLSAASPCRGAGTSAHTSGTDLDGEAWDHPPSIGCDEYWSGSVTGLPGVSIAATHTNVPAGFVVGLTGTIVGKASATVWDFGDGVQVSNLLYMNHAWTNDGSYAVVLTAYNDDYPGGVSATQTLHVVAQVVFYVAQDNTNPLPPYTNWATAAQDIQSAVDLATLPGQWVLVSNGVYRTGGRLVSTTPNRVAVQRATRVASVNGPEVTIIEGQRGAGGGIGPGAVRCVYLASGALLDGFTLRNGATTAYDFGGGVYCSSSAAVLTNCILHANYGYLGGGACLGTLNNCLLRYNSAYADGGGGYATTFNDCTLLENGAVEDGGGASSSTLNRCLLTQNRAIDHGGASYQSTLNHCVLRRNNAEYGGAAYYGTLNNCTVVDNYAYSYAGGALYGTLRNCIVYHNGSPSSPNSLGGTLNSCCTLPNPGTGAGNITNEPLFINVAGGDLRLHSNSPCINAGNNAYASGSTDMDGNPRIVGGTVDLGAYEFQSPASLISHAWLQQYGWPADGSADTTDPDGDLFNNWQEWVADTNPTNALSCFRVLSVSNGPPMILLFPSALGRLYTLHAATNLGGPTPQGAGWTSVPGQTDVPGTGGTGVLRDTNAAPAQFYRVSVRMP